MTWARFFGWCAFASPALVFSCMAWLYLHVGIAVIFMITSTFWSGYATRWLDEGFKKEEQTQNILNKYRGPV